MSRSEAIDPVRRATGMAAQTGPFAGMRMTTLQSWDGGEDIAPQLLGTCEQELHPTLTRPMARNHRTVVNVGCAEGFCTVGLARCRLRAHVCVFDVDERAGLREHAPRPGAVTNPEAARCFGQKGKTLLLKKKQQKDVAHGAPGARVAPEPKEQKFFGSFFQERTCLLLAISALPPPPDRQEIPCAWSS